LLSCPDSIADAVDAADALVSAGDCANDAYPPAVSQSSGEDDDDDDDDDNCDPALKIVKEKERRQANNARERYLLFTEFYLVLPSFTESHWLT